MTTRRIIQSQLEMLRELSEVMVAMKNISLMETHRLRRFISTQMRVVKNAEAMAEDFLSHYPQRLVPPRETPAVYLLIGSERGFCGDFNVALLRSLGEDLEAGGVTEPVLVPMGRKLCARLEKDPRVAGSLEGPGIVEEVDGALSRVVETLSGLRPGGEPFSPLSLVVLYHEVGDHASAVRIRRPLRELGRKTARFPHPPVLTMTPEDFFGDWVDQYLFAALHAFFYSSLMSEHLRRLHHLDGAIGRLDKQRDRLTLKDHALRQEEITEEIELILLSAEESADSEEGEATGKSNPGQPPESPERFARP
jgi:F-type H+-transporting ATPase subunit gamma